ncbi:hypothetical protein [[Muricauda] lutisoli]|uniref:Uncharacterized protein n=1 Tax=[Muricauda] lutisoli TaxID=2816035 RepID=A0ABS3EVH8_9FLAO|nr:hypothetical protein [[Muricauda] lutisoli]MBO0329757.1 hypothetical protein [[Muricauda] lutisoli]
MENFKSLGMNQGNNEKYIGLNDHTKTTFGELLEVKGMPVAHILLQTMIKTFEQKSKVDESYRSLLENIDVFCGIACNNAWFNPNDLLDLARKKMIGDNDTIYGFTMDEFDLLDEDFVRYLWMITGVRYSENDMEHPWEMMKEFPCGYRLIDIINNVDNIFMSSLYISPDEVIEQFIERMGLECDSDWASVYTTMNEKYGMDSSEIGSIELMNLANEFFNQNEVA